MSIRDLEGELKRLPSEVPVSARRALEIGCGPGRLMRPMSRHFGEIHGVDVSDEMIVQARAKLRDIPWAHAHHASGSDLARFPSDHFDFVYSYAVFQHIPSAEVVFSYLRETVRVLKPGGFARLQINGLPKIARAYTTWAGVRISADEIRRFTRDQGVRLLSLTGVDTQYMWTSWQKPPAMWERNGNKACRIRHVVNAFSGEQAVPSSGRLACATLQIESLPAACDLNSLEGVRRWCRGRWLLYRAAGERAFAVQRISSGGRANRAGAGARRVEWAAALSGRNYPSDPGGTGGPAACFGQRRREFAFDPADRERHGEGDDRRGGVRRQFRRDCGWFPSRGIWRPFEPTRWQPRYEVNFDLPDELKAGGHVLEVRLGTRTLAQTGIEVG